MDAIRTTRQHLEHALHPEGMHPAYGAGLRAALATVLPLVVTAGIDQPGGSWAALAGFLAVLADKGGLYRTRAGAMAAATLVAALSAFVATLAGGHPVLAVALMFLWATAAGLLRVLGALGASLSAGAAIVFTVALAHPGPPSQAWTAALMALAGGAWAMVLSLVFWPVRYDRPARAALAGCFRALGDYAAMAVLAAGRGEPPPRDGFARPGADRVRQALEGARAGVVAGRRGRLGRSGREERLLVLLETADRILGLLVALADEVDALPAGAAGDEARARLEPALSVLPGALRRTATEVQPQRGQPSAPAGEGVVLASQLPAAGEEAAPAVAERLLRRIADFLTAAEEAAAGLDHPAPSPMVETTAPVDPSGPGPLRPVLDQLTPSSLVARHALRLGLATAAGVLVARALGLSHGYWITVTVVVILQPYRSATIRKGMQRLLGTVAGAVIAALLAAALRDPNAVLALVFLLAGIAVAVRPINYTLYAIFGTPTFVLLAELGAGDFRLAGARVVNTLIGGALAFAAAALLWPGREREEATRAAAGAVRAVADYLRIAAAPDHAPAAATAARRRLGVALLEAEAVAQRVAGESSDRRHAASYLAVVAFTRRLSSAVTALAAEPVAVRPVAQRTEEAAFVAGASAALNDVADALATGRPPAPLPEPVLAAAEVGEAAALAEARPRADEVTPDVVRAAALHRAARRLIVLHAAAGRVTAGAEDAV